MEDLISVIVPVYNVKDYIDECIKSILNQTYKNIEVIIVDDGSDDGSSIICDKYEKMDNRVTVIHQTNHGLSAARNQGLSVCKGKYVSFVDSDDYLEKDFVEVLYKLIKKYSVKVSISQIKILKGNEFSHGSTSLLNQYGELVNGKDCIFNTYVWNKLYDIEIWRKLKFDTGKYYEDIYITYQIMYNEDKIAVSDRELYIYRKRPGSISSKFFDVCKTKDFLDASKQRMDYMIGKEKYLYDICVDRQLGAIRLYYGALYSNDKKKYKSEMKELVKESRKLYFPNFLNGKIEFKNNMKNFVFVCMPNIFSYIKTRTYKK